MAQRTVTGDRIAPNNRQAVTFSPDLWEMIGKAATIEGIPPTIWVRAQIILLLRKAGVTVMQQTLPGIESPALTNILAAEEPDKGAPF